MTSFHDHCFIHPDDISLSDVTSLGTTVFSAYINNCNNEYSCEAAVDRSTDRLQPPDRFYELTSDVDALCNDINCQFDPTAFGNVAITRRDSMESHLDSVSTHFVIDSGQLIVDAIDRKLAVIAKLEAQERGNCNEHGVGDGQRAVGATDELEGAV
jgi:hypothetical protein